MNTRVRSCHALLGTLLSAASAAGLAGLAGCGEDTSPASDAGPGPDADVPAECLPGKNGARFEEKIIFMNELETNPLMFNALTTNRAAQEELVASKLHSDTFDSRQPTANPYLVEQLADVWSQRLFSFLVRCALPPERSVTWQHPVTGDIHTWSGERGFCPAWYDGGITDNEACQELVSACLLATNNAYGERVRISMHGVRDGASLPLSTAVSGAAGGASSVQPCPGDAPAGDPARDCGWRVDQVGTCRAGVDVELSAAAPCDDTMARVCSGNSGCDAADGAAATASICAGDPLAFTCPPGGQFTVMTAAGEPDAQPGGVAVDSTFAVYPAAEPLLFSVREGAFYGNLFLGPEGIDDRIGVRVEDGRVIYSFAPDTATEPGDYEIYDTACSGHDSVDEPALRSARHARFIEQVQDSIAEDITVYPRLYACWDPGWSEGAAYEARRVCTGPSGEQFCAARPVGACWASRTAPSTCMTDDTSGDTGVTAGDRDYSGCSDPLGDVWKRPITVFLDDPCAVVTDPDACAVRRVTSVSAGLVHTCVLLSTGEVRCWGSGTSGRLGYGNTDTIGDDEASAAAGSVDVGGRVMQIAAGGAHTCALMEGGAVRCWGDNFYGQLGYGHTNAIGDDETPSAAGDVPVGGVVTRIVAGQEHTCALLEGGAVRCWGNGSNGRLGYGNVDSIGDDETPEAAGDVPLGSAAVALAAGDSHTCALLEGGEVRCWGNGSRGRLGYGNVDSIGDDETPASLAAGVSTGGAVAAITAGGAHTCALLESGEVLCWGQGDNGRLGYGNTDDVGATDTPADVGPVDVGATVTAIAAGGLHTCALTGAGDVRCWGLGTLGQLGYGNGDTLGDTEAPASAGIIDLGRDTSPPPDGGALSTLTAGSSHTCAVVSPGNARCWGNAANGQLGYGAVDAVGDDEVPAAAGDVPVF